MCDLESAAVIHQACDKPSNPLPQQQPFVHTAIDTLVVFILCPPGFLPSPPKFHYQFHLRDVSNIFQGLLDTDSSLYDKGAVKFMRVRLDECECVFTDRLIHESYRQVLGEVLTKVLACAVRDISGQALACVGV